MINDNPLLIDLIERGIFLTSTLKQIQIELREIKKSLRPLFKQYETNRLETRAGSAVLSVRENWIIENMFADEIRKIVRDLWEDWVAVDVTYKPKDPMKEALINADDPLGNELRPFVKIKETESITFKPVKKNEHKTKKAG